MIKSIFKGENMSRVINVFVLFAGLLLVVPTAFAAGSCSNIVNLTSVSASARGGKVIYKGNANSNGGELPFSAGNHSQAGPAFLFLARSGLAPSGGSLNIMDHTGKTIATGFSRPQCTNLGCGEHKRWYTGYGSARALKRKAPKGLLFQGKGSTCYKVSNVYSRREQY